jgi:quinol monooxygenase YgiN
VTEEDTLFRLVARFTLRPGAEAEFDQLARRTATQVLRGEPGIVQYICYKVDGQPRLRIFYEEYEHRAAFEDHEAREHTLRFLAAREPLLETAEVHQLTPMAGGFRGPHPAVAAEADV